VRASRGLAEPIHLFERVFRNADLRRLELAWAASNFASRASAIAVAVYAYETDGVGAVGIIAFLRLAVAAGASPWLAVLADRRARRLVLISSDLVRCLILGVMAALVVVEAAPFAVYTLAVLAAVAEPSSDPRRWRSPPRSWRRLKSSLPQTSSQAPSRAWASLRVLRSGRSC
jgi:MFS family permease